MTDRLPSQGAKRRPPSRYPHPTTGHVGPWSSGSLGVGTAQQRSTATLGRVVDKPAQEPPKRAFVQVPANWKDLTEAQQRALAAGIAAALQRRLRPPSPEPAPRVER